MSNSGIEKIAKKLEIATNVLIMLAAIVIIVLFIKYRGAVPTQSAGIRAGSYLAVNGITWDNSGKDSLILALSASCHFCTESSSFYQQATQKSREQHIRTIAVLPQPLDEARSYLARLQIPVDEVRQASFQSISIVGTPTLLLVDDKGIVKKVWAGKLSDGYQKEVFVSLAQ